MEKVFDFIEAVKNGIPEFFNQIFYLLTLSLVDFANLFSMGWLLDLIGSLSNELQEFFHTPMTGILFGGGITLFLSYCIISWALKVFK